MPKAKGKNPVAEPEIAIERTQISSVIFGLVMVVALIVAGAALLGGSLSQIGKRWGSAMDGVSRTIGLSVDTIEVVGLEHVPAVARQVKMAAMIEPGENMFRADPHLIRRRVLDTQLVTKVRVYRMWPDTLMIHAHAPEPTALWNDGSQWAVVDSLGRIMPNAAATDFPHLTKAIGQGGAEAIPALDHALAQVPDLRENIELARRIADRRWDLVLRSGAIMRLPADEQMGSSLMHYADLSATAALESRPVDVIDLRVTGRIFLTPKADRTGGAA